MDLTHAECVIIGPRWVESEIEIQQTMRTPFFGLQIGQDGFISRMHYGSRAAVQAGYSQPTLGHDLFRGGRDRRRMKEKEMLK